MVRSGGRPGLCLIGGARGGPRRYLNMNLFKEMEKEEVADEPQNHRI